MRGKRLLQSPRVATETLHCTCVTLLSRRSKRRPWGSRDRAQPIPGAGGRAYTAGSGLVT